jgi:hypothetical protein
MTQIFHREAGAARRCGWDCAQNVQKTSEKHLWIRGRFIRDDLIKIYCIIFTKPYDEALQRK